MKAAIRNTEVLRSVSPRSLDAYLRVKRWHLEDQYQDRVAYWSWQGSSEGLELELPLRQEFGDYALRIREALDILSEVERRPAADVLGDLLTATFDVMRVRLDYEGIKDGTIKLDDGVGLFDNTRKLLSSAARSVVKPKPHYVAGMPNKVTEYLSDVRVGQTERGSYVIALLSPVPTPAPTSNQDPLFEAEAPDPFERVVSKTLLQALEVAKSSAEQIVAEWALGSLQNMIAKGVSANLCEALVQISNSGGGAGLDVDLRWAFTKPVAEETHRTVTFNPQAMPVIEQVGRLLREQPVQENYMLQGYVTRLSRERGDDEGTIVVHGPVDDTYRRVLVELGTQDYRRAAQAHEAGSPVACYGQLQRIGKHFVLHNPQGLRVLHKEDPDDVLI